MRRLRIVIVAFVVVLAALALAAVARPQALIVNTAGTAGKGSHSIAPIDLSQENGDTKAAASAGHGTGSAARADAQNGDDSATAAVGCIDAAASSGGLGGSASLGNCAGGSQVGGGGGAGVDNGAIGGGLDLGCLTAALDGSPSAGLQVGACEGSAAGDDDTGTDTDEPGQGGGVAGEEAGGVLGEQAGGALDGSGSGDGGRGNTEPCGTFDQMAAFAGPGSLPAWLFALVALGGFGLGTFLARRRSKGVG